MKKRWIYAVVLVTIAVAVVIYSTTKKEKTVEITVKVEEGIFNVVVSTTGELQALNSVDIRGPQELRQVRVHDVKIVDLVPEGTVVEEGDYVASLDRTQIQERLNNQADELEEDEANLGQAVLDTTISLLDNRNTIKDMAYSVEEKEIILDQSQYEPPATIRQAEMNLDKSKRAYEQAVANYALKKAQAESKIRRAEKRLEEEYQEREELIAILDQFDIYAPDPGMVIYKKEWGGAKRKVGSSITPWNPVVATLPDLSQMISKTYVNEIDISKLETGQIVELGVDAFPEREYTGVVTVVANVGEQLPNSDAKVFEVVVLLNESDTTLRPAMTTVNKINTNSYENVKYIPLESVHNTDSMSYVILAKEKIKQIVDLGEANENYIIVDEGLQAGDELFLTLPEDSDELEFRGWDIFEKVQKRRLEEEQRMREEAERMRKIQQERQKDSQKFNMRNLTPEQMKAFEGMRNQGRSGTSGSGNRRGSSSGSSRSGSVSVQIQR